MELKDIMTTDVEVIRPDATVEEAAARLRDLNVGSLPVCDGKRLYGMLTDRDITIRATAVGGSPADTRVSDVMTPDVVFAYNDQSVEEVTQLMSQHQIRRLPVVDRDKNLVGIVALGDIAVEGQDRLSGDALEDISQPSDINL